MKILIIGAAGFIGSNIAKFLSEKGYEVIGVDIIQDMFEVHSKYLRLEYFGFSPNQLRSGLIVKSNKFENLDFLKLDITDNKKVKQVFEQYNIEYVFHFASREGIRNNLTKPEYTISVNINGFVNVIEAARIPTTGLRFFPIYGPFDRPDSIIYNIVKCIFNNNPVSVTNEGENLIDLTYIDDILEVCEKIMLNHPVSKSYYTEKNIDFSSSSAPFKLYNIGSGRPVTWNQLIKAIEKAVDVSGEKVIVQEQFTTHSGNYSDISGIVTDFSFKQEISIEKGIQLFVSWYKKFFEN